MKKTRQYTIRARVPNMDDPAFEIEVMKCYALWNI